jgi:hypothetical protein
MGRLFGRGATATSTPTAPQVPSVPAGAYALQSEGPCDIVGESYYQDALKATRSSLRYDRELGREIFDAYLVPEPENKYDSRAIAVYSAAGKIGHAPRGSLWIQVFERLTEAGHATAACRAFLIGGDEGKFLGAMLCADPDEELNFLD